MDLKGKAKKGFMKALKYQGPQSLTLDTLAQILLRAKCFWCHAAEDRPLHLDPAPGSCTKAGACDGGRGYAMIRVKKVQIVPAGFSLAISQVTGSVELEKACQGRGEGRGWGLRAASGVGNVPRSTRSSFPFQDGFHVERSCCCKIYWQRNIEVERDTYLALRPGLRRDKLTGAPADQLE